MVELGELNRLQDSNPTTEKVLDSSAKSTSFAAFMQDKAGPKKAEKDPNNPSASRSFGTVRRTRKILRSRVSKMPRSI
jgi:hypothetical protein